MEYEVNKAAQQILPADGSTELDTTLIIFSYVLLQGRGPETRRKEVRLRWIQATLAMNLRYNSR